MGPDYRDNSGTRPRDDYAPRTLIDSRAQFLARIAQPNDHAADESLPDGWEILWPNRIRERRLQCGIETTTILAKKAGHISYQRLCRLECGTHIGRQSELELIARPLECEPEDLLLPPLSLSQTAQWKHKWGARRTCGGNHDAVILAAFVRYLVDQTGLSRSKLIASLSTAERPISLNALSGIWHAEKSIDRWPDSTMACVMKIAGLDSWDAVIAESRSYYQDGSLIGALLEVKQPRLRYAPDDPDARAPWTFAIDPFRTRRPRQPHQAAHTTLVRSETKTEAAQRLIRERREERIERTRRICRSVITWSRNTTNIEQRLIRLFPKEKEQACMAARELTETKARIGAARARIVQISDRRNLHVKTAATMLAITPERFRQLAHLPKGSIHRTGFGGSVGNDAH